MLFSHVDTNLLIAAEGVQGEKAISSMAISLPVPDGAVETITNMTEDAGELNVMPNFIQVNIEDVRISPEEIESIITLFMFLISKRTLGGLD